MVAEIANIALAETWLGLALAYTTEWPTSFWIALLGCSVYFLPLRWMGR